MKQIQLHAASLFLAAWSFFGFPVASNAQSSTGRPISDCYDFARSQPDTSLFRIDDTLCLMGPVWGDNVDLTLIDPSVRVLVVFSSGGSLNSFVKLSERLREAAPLVVVPDLCLSGCATVLLPSSKRVVVAEKAFVAFHGRLFQTKSDYREFVTKRNTKPFPQEIPDGTKKDEMIAFGFRKYLADTEAAQRKLGEMGVGSGIFDYWKIIPKCFDENLNFQSWQYLTTADKATFSQWVDTSEWTWPEGQTPRIPASFKSPICDPAGKLFYVPPRNRPAST